MAAALKDLLPPPKPAPLTPHDAWFDEGISSFRSGCSKPPAAFRPDPKEEERETQREIEESTRRTKEALEKIVDARFGSAQAENAPTQSSGSRFIKYRPSQRPAAFSSGAQERVIRMAETPADPLEPPKFKRGRVPGASGPPPVPVMHSPPRAVTAKDQQDWKVPPCVSDWKNPKGYAVPLDKRLAADGRGLQEAQISDNFARLSEALYVAEQKAREAVATRSRVQRALTLKEKERKERELRALAQKRTEPRRETRGAGREQRAERDQLREERRRERERERRLEARDAATGRKGRLTRDRDRDVGEKVALGMADTGAGQTGGVTYDQRLFNQEKGMESGFAADGHEYNVYDHGLFTAQPTLSTLYRPNKDGADADMHGGADGRLEKVTRAERFEPDEGFAGASGGPRGSKRERPVEFDEQEEDDPFGLEQFLTEVKRGKKATDKIGGGGTSF